MTNPEDREALACRIEAGEILKDKDIHGVITNVFEKKELFHRGIEAQ